jgi:RNA polymerase sigma factor for flagellar operon FliA
MSNNELSPLPTPKQVDIDVGMGLVSQKEKDMVKEYSYIIDAVASILYAKKKMPPTIDYNDLHSIGFDGLLKAIRNFKNEKGVQFKTYANIRVRGEMLDLIRREWRVKSATQHDDFMKQIKERVDQVVNAKIESEPGKVDVKNLLAVATTSYMVSLETVLDAQGDNIEDGGVAVDKSFELKDEYQFLNDLLQCFPKEDVTFIDLFYRQGLKQKEIAKRLNMSESKVSRNHCRILSDLRQKMDANC